MKNANTKISLNPFIKKQIKELNDDAKKSRRRYRGVAITLSVINLIMIGVAAAAIDLLINYHQKHGVTSDQTGVILTSFAAALIVIMFILQFAISIYRSKRKQDVYKNAMDEIQLEVIKHSEGFGEYSNKTKDKLLEEKCESIKKKAIEVKHKKKISSLVLKGLVGGEDA